jgi:hypothetical protein
LPPPLPPESRTVGQVIAEAIHLYRRRFWWALLLGVPVAALDQASASFSGWAQSAFQWAFAPALTAAFVGASVLALGRQVPRRSLALAFAAGVIVFLPAPLLLRVYVLPLVLWFAFVGLAVPAAVVEGLGVRRALRRGVELGRADYVHAAGGIATAVIVYVLSRLVLAVLLHSQADAAERASAFLADLVLSPILFLVPALLYFDQAARARLASGSRPRRRDADVHHAVEPDVPGRPDAQVEPRPAAGGEP